MVMEEKKNRRSLRTALVLGAAVAGTALVGFGGLAAWQAYTQNSGNAFAVGTLTHTNTAGTGTSVTCDSNTIKGNASSNCAIIVSGTALTSEWTSSFGKVTIASTGSLSSTFQMSMPSVPAPVHLSDGNLCGDLTLTVTDNQSPTTGTPYPTAFLSNQMTPTTLLAQSGDGNSSPWVTGDTGTFTFTVAAISGFGSNASVLGTSCSFDILFTQASA